MSSRKDMVSHGKAHKRNEHNRGEIPLKPIHVVICWSEREKLDGQEFKQFLRLWLSSVLSSSFLMSL